MARGKGAAILPPAFFARPAVEVARDLIGASVVRLLDEQLRRFHIIETEAYEGVHDLASHSSKGRTPRTEVMFGLAGRFYVYRVYGLHWMLNVVTGKIGDAAAVLIRGVEGVSGRCMAKKQTAHRDYGSNLEIRTVAPLGSIAQRGSALTMPDRSGQPKNSASFASDSLEELHARPGRWPTKHPLLSRSSRMPRFQMDKPRKGLVRKPAMNETFYHRQSGGFGDELIKLQIEERKKQEREKALKPLALKDIAEGD